MFLGASEYMCKPREPGKPFESPNTFGVLADMHEEDDVEDMPTVKDEMEFPVLTGNKGKKGRKRMPKAKGNFRPVDREKKMRDTTEEAKMLLELVDTAAQLLPLMKDESIESKDGQGFRRRGASGATQHGAWSADQGVEGIQDESALRHRE